MAIPRAPKGIVADPKPNNTWLNPPRRPTGGAGSPRGPVPPKEGFSFAFDRAEDNRIPYWIKEPDPMKKIPMALDKCIDYASDEWMRHYRNTIPHEGYDITAPDARIEEAPRWCKINK